MNSLDTIFKILAMALVLLISLAGYSTGADPIPSSWSEPDPVPVAKGQTLEQNSKAKRIALSGAAQLFKKTPIGKNLNQYRKRLVRNVRFEYTKVIDNGGSDLGKTIAQTKNGEKESLKTVSFSGELDHNLSPVLEFNSRMDIIDFSSTFHLMDHEVACDISSRPMNDFIGGRAAVGLRSDGDNHQAVIRLKFDF